MSRHSTFRAVANIAIYLACVGITTAPAFAYRYEEAPLHALAGTKFDCKNFKDGLEQYVFDFSGLPFPLTIQSTENTPPTTTTMAITMNLCAHLDRESDVPDEEQCPKGTRVCVKVINEKKGSETRVTQVIPAAGEGPDLFTWSADLGKHTKGGQRELNFNMHGGMYAEIRQQVDIQFQCDESVDKTSKPEFQKYDREDGILKLRWTTPHACGQRKGGGGVPPSSGDTVQPGGSEASGGAISSFFSWFFFLVIVGGVAYLAIGFWRNYNEYGVIEIPNKDFWREAPYIAKDMGRHVYQTVAGQGSSRGAYEPV